MPPPDTLEQTVELAGFRGKLEEIGLPSILGVLERERRTGVLVLDLEPGRGKAHLHLSEGRVFRAHLDGREEPRNAELVYGLIAGVRGTFDFRPLDEVLDDDVRCSTTLLIFEAARRMNEALPAPLEADRRAPASGKTLEWNSARRWISAKDAVAALAMAAFVLVVLTAGSLK